MISQLLKNAKVDSLCALFSAMSYIINYMIHLNLHLNQSTHSYDHVLNKKFSFIQ